jgi:transcriptional regulator with XRE-family HTH domain
MKLKITQEWLARKLAQADDTCAGAGGTDTEQLKKEADLRMVTRTAFAAVDTELGKVVRFIREQRGWTQRELADIATVDESEITAIEANTAYVPSPRAVVYLADALGLSRGRLKELVGFVLVRDKYASNDAEFRYAAKSRGMDGISEDEYDALRALVEVLSEKNPKR